MMRLIPTRNHLIAERTRLLLKATDGEKTLEDLRNHLEKHPDDEDTRRAIEDFQPTTIPYAPVARHLRTTSRYLARHKEGGGAHLGLEEMKNLILEGKPLPSEQEPAPRHSSLTNTLTLVLAATATLFILATITLMLLDITGVLP